MSGTVFAQAKEADLAWVDGQIQMNTSDGGQGLENVPVLTVLPQSQVSNDA